MHSLERLNAVLEMADASTSEAQMAMKGPWIEGYACKVFHGQAVPINGKTLQEQTNCCDGYSMSPTLSIDTASTRDDGSFIGLRTRLSCSSIFSSDSDDCEAPVMDLGIDSQQHGHKSEPREHNLAQTCDDSCRAAAPTTMMIRNIPRRYSQEYLLMDLHDLGFEGTFDFLFLPRDKITSACVGYAFVNFTSPYWAEQCIHSFKDYEFKRHQRGMSKVAQVCVAQMQGLEKNLQHFKDGRHGSTDKMLSLNVLFSIAGNSKSEA
jgi:hypothetical protein